MVRAATLGTHSRLRAAIICSRPPCRIGALTRLGPRYQAGENSRGKATWPSAAEVAAVWLPVMASGHIAIWLGRADLQPSFARLNTAIVSAAGPLHARPITRLDIRFTACDISLLSGLPARQRTARPFLRAASRDRPVVTSAQENGPRAIAVLSRNRDRLIAASCPLRFCPRISLTMVIFRGIRAVEIALMPKAIWAGGPART